MIRNYAAFYFWLKQLPLVGFESKEEQKWMFVRNASEGRTESLTELTDAEYGELIRTLKAQASSCAALRQRRSGVLRLMQQMGVDTADWARVDALCMDKRIAGKRFGHLGYYELGVLYRKLRGIWHKGGLKATKEGAWEVIVGGKG